MRRLQRTCAVLALPVLVGLGAPTTAWGADDDALGDPLTLDAVLAYARQRNPEIRAAVAKWQAAQARPAQAGALPDPMVDLAYHNESFNRVTQGSSDFAGWSIGPATTPRSGQDSEDVRDAEDLYHKLGSVISPLYFGDRVRWVEIMRHCIALNASFFNTHRMVQQYATSAYL